MSERLCSRPAGFEKAQAQAEQISVNARTQSPNPKHPNTLKKPKDAEGLYAIQGSEYLDIVASSSP